MKFSTDFTSYDKVKNKKSDSNDGFDCHRRTDATTQTPATLTKLFHGVVVCEEPKIFFRKILFMEFYYYNYVIYIFNVIKSNNFLIRLIYCQDKLGSLVLADFNFPACKYNFSNYFNYLTLFILLHWYKPKSASTLLASGCDFTKPDS